MLKVFLLTLLIVGIALLLLSIRVLLLRGGRFRSFHIHDSKAMRQRGIGCVMEQDKEVRRQQKNNNNRQLTLHNMKAHTLILAAALMGAGMTACNNGNQEQGASASGKGASAKDAKIAYVEVDSIMSQYQFCKDMEKELEKKGANSQQHIQSKGQALQQAAANFQQGLQSNKYTQEQAQSIQANLQKQDNDLQALQQRLAAEFQTTQDAFNKTLHDSIQNFLAVYNKDKKYTYILSKQGDNILYADPACDITKEVIEGLNKAYKPAKKAE